MRNLSRLAGFGIALLVTVWWGDAEAAGGSAKLVVIGDSLSAGYQLKAAEAFPAQLERALQARGHSVTVINAGVSGDTATDGLARLDWSVEGDADAVIVALGANDMLRGIDPAVTRRALDQILTKLSARRLPVLLVGMLAPPNMGPDFRRAFDGMYVDLADQRRVLLHPFFLDGVAAEPRLLLRDGMHPNSDGVAVMVERILPAAEALLAQIARRP
ncbi:MAG: arylesterase [Bauldia sp.]